MSDGLCCHARGLIKRAPRWCSIRAALCRRSDGYCRVPGGTAVESRDIKVGHGEKSRTCKPGKDKDSGIYLESGSTEEA